MIRNRLHLGSAPSHSHGSAIAGTGLDVPVRSSNLTFLVGLLIFSYCPIVQSHAKAATIDFDSLPDSSILIDQYPALTFANTIVLSAGVGVNEFEFPPYSGTNVASDNNGAISITFASPVTSFSGYFTYAAPLTIQAFNLASAQVGSASSLFSSNDALFGEPGSLPNEFLQVSSASGIAGVTITGDPAGGSFVMDDIEYTPVSPAVPEPRAFTLLLTLGLASLGLRRLRVLRP